MARKKRSLTDQEIGERVRVARERVRMPQQHIATVMTIQYGHSWHQTTVGRMEAGQRALKLTEAVAVAQIIGIPLADLVSDEPTGLERGLAIKELAVLSEQIEKRIEKLREF